MTLCSYSPTIVTRVGFVHISCPCQDPFWKSGLDDTRVSYVVMTNVCPMFWRISLVSETLMTPARQKKIVKPGFLIRGGGGYRRQHVVFNRRPLTSI